MQLKDRLSTHLITAQGSEDIPELRILVDDPSHRLAQKIYKTYISQTDFAKFHSFLIDFDRLLARFGGQAQPQMRRPS
ncbi:MAG: hypothetical protein KGH75_01505 [Rhodospirillales bacterium]|nr:hypothetical protein [Rhodospirillales bacterium]